MTSVTEQLLSRINDEDPFDYRLEDIQKLQFSAATERLKRAIETMPVLERRAVESGIERIDSLEDILPLFFSDATYKSYPESLVNDGKWKALGSWLDALSADTGAADVDFSGVNNIDDWLFRLREAGHFVYVSSGTSGKCSLYKVSEADRAHDRSMYQLGWRWATGALPDKSRVVFGLFPTKGSHRMVDSFGTVIEDFGRPDAKYFLTKEPLLVSNVNALGRLKKAMAAGTATPGDIKKLEEMSAERQANMNKQMAKLAEEVVKHQDEPAIFLATWAPLYFLTQAARELGWKGAHPESVLFTGGGLKGIELPPDYQEKIKTAHGLSMSSYFEVYGCSEQTSFHPACSAHRYHCPPWVIPMVLDKDGEKLVKSEGGKMTGRLAFFDLSMDARWGALITGDHGTLNLNPCSCGREGPSIMDDIVRYKDLPGGDDKVTCSGTIDNYVRGMIDDE